LVGRLYIDGACGINLRLRRVELTIDTRIVIYGCDVPGIGDLKDTENAGNVVSLPSGCRGSLIIAGLYWSVASCASISLMAPSKSVVSCRRSSRMRMASVITSGF